MIEPDLIPGRVLSRQSIADLNALLARLNARKVERIAVMEPNGFRASGLVKVFNQAHLRRNLVLAESAYGLFFLQKGLVSLMAIRSIYETVAAYLAFEREFTAIMEGGSLQAIFEFVKNRTHTTRIPKLISEHGAQVTATNILTHIAKLEKLRPTVKEEYDFLSDHTHPNGIGTVIYFRVEEEPGEVVVFSDSGPDPEADLQWILVGIKLLEHFEAALDRVEALLPALSTRGEAEKPAKT